ncbi:MAG: hypothetical protein U0176_08950 [Bacteroidia bacterium]
MSKLAAQIKATFDKAYGSAASKMQDSPDFGRIITPRHQERLAGLVQASVAAGAQVLIGGKGDTANRYLDRLF